MPSLVMVMVALRGLSLIRASSPKKRPADRAARFPVWLLHSRDHGLALLDHEEGVAIFPFVDHGFAKLYLSFLEFHEQGVDHGRGDGGEQFR